MVDLYEGSHISVSVALLWMV